MTKRARLDLRCTCGPSIFGAWPNLHRPALLRPGLTKIVKKSAIAAAALFLTSCVTNPDGSVNEAGKQTKTFFGQMASDFQSLLDNLPQAGGAGSKEDNRAGAVSSQEKGVVEPQTMPSCPAPSPLGPLANLFSGSPPVGAGRCQGGIAGTLNRLTSTNLLAMSMFNAALGEKSKAEVLMQEAKCAESGTCAHGINKTLEIMQDASEDLRKKTAELRQSQVRLEETAARQALEGILPAIKAVPLWALVVAQTKQTANNLDIAGSVMLITALPKIPAAFVSSRGMLVAVTDYITFSGVDTSSVYTPALDAI